MRDIQDFASLRIKLASPEDIHAWSYGEVKKPETINYRTLKPEQDGLFCEKIFGTMKEWECYCGKFKSIRYKGIKCDRCGVEVTHFKVRRERTGHINLAAPVAHIWYYGATPSRIGNLLGLQLKALQSVLYFERYIVTDAGNTTLEKMKLLTEEEYLKYREQYGESAFQAEMGAEAIKTLLENFDLDGEYKKLHDRMIEKGNKVDKHDLKRIELIDDFRNSGNKPSWMILDVVPVIPPDIRPMVQLDGGRFASADLNDLYRRVINRNNRLKKLQDLFAPDIIIRNEKRMLQEAVDALFDNGKRKNRIIRGPNNRPLKSISDLLKGKQGRFRQNLLGKRVDYSGRSVIVVGPELKLWQCGLPEKMALELFKPFIMRKLQQEGVVGTMKRARALVEQEAPEVYDVLDEVVREHPVMLNRAPTLHRLGIQAFEPVLVSGKALKLHPLACKAFNADFDGDQMAIHVPLTQAAQMECWDLMLSARNLLDPANGKTIVYPSQDMVLGIYYMTAIKPTANGGPVSVSRNENGVITSENTRALLKSYITAEEKERIQHKLYSSVDEVRLAAESGAISWQAEIKLLKSGLNKCVHGDNEATLKEKYLLTSAGRLAFNEAMPAEVDFYNEQLGDKELRAMIESVYHTEQTSDILIRELVSEKLDSEKIDDAAIDTLLADSDVRRKINLIYNRKKNFTEEELRHVINAVFNNDRSWLTVQMLDAIKDTGYKNATFFGATLSMDDILVPEEKKSMVAKTDETIKELIEKNNNGVISDTERYDASVDEWSKTTDELTDKMYKDMQKDQDGFNTIYMMANSGARGSKKQISQLAAMRGLMQKPNGQIIELPIRSNFKEGLSVIEYFISTNGARKGLSDTALKTADAGYMTRRLVDVAQNVVVNEEDCGTINGIDYTAIKDGENIVESLSSRIEGHFSAERVLDPVTKELLCDVNQYIDESLSRKIEKAGVEKVKLRTVLTCESKHGICVKCYGKDLARNKVVEVGEAVGTIAAQSIGQPGTQLTLRTFHTGGAAETSAKDNFISMKYDVYISKVEGPHVVRHGGKQEGNWLFTRRGYMTLAKLFNTYTFTDSDSVLVENKAHVRKNKAILKKNGKEIFPSNDGRIIVDEKNGKLFLVSNDQEMLIENGSTIYAQFTEEGVVAKEKVHIGEVFPNSEPIISETEGYIHFVDIKEGETMDSSKKIVDIHAQEKQPRILIWDDDGNPLGTYHLPSGTTIEKDIVDGKFVSEGEVLAKIPKEGAKASDITLGLPRVSELFEGRKSKDPAVIAKVSGTVSLGGIKKGKVTVTVTDEFDGKHDHLIPIAKRLLVRDGDVVKAGEVLCAGAKDPHDVLAVLGENELQNFLMNEIQAVYREQKVTIHDKHIGTIIRQMLRKVLIIKVGDTKFIFGQQVDKYIFHEENERVIAGGGQPAVACPLFQGITKAALATDSFISASSFQETTKVLTNAAIAGKYDHLRGLKENVIIGHMIPAGTGMPQYHNVKLSDASSADLDEKMEEILALRQQEKRMEEALRQEEEMGMGGMDSSDDD